MRSCTSCCILGEGEREREKEVRYVVRLRVLQLDYVKEESKIRQLCEREGDGTVEGKELGNVLRGYILKFVNVKEDEKIHVDKRIER